MKKKIDKFYMEERAKFADKIQQICSDTFSGLCGGIVEYEYDYFGCEESDCGCRDSSDYCRNGVYHNLRCTKVDNKLSEVADSLHCKFLKRFPQIVCDKDIFYYCINRILTSKKHRENFLSVHNWNIEQDRGYYGNEIGGASWDYLGYFSTDLANCFFSASSVDRLVACLEIEYGKTPPQFTKLGSPKSVCIQRVLLNNIVFASDHYETVLEKNGDNNIYLTNDAFCAIAGVGFIKNDNVKLIDGHHRCAAAQKRGDDYVDILCFEF